MATRGQKFLRGLQMADAQGNANFVTIYPGWVSRADGAHPDEDGRLQVSDRKSVV